MGKRLQALTALLLTCSFSMAQQANEDITIVGAMRNVMWKGELYGNIDLDTIANKKHLYGLGPVEYLTGELMILDGSSYKSTVVNDSSMKVEETYKVKAPFFGYTNIEKWTEQYLPDSVRSIQQLEIFLDRITATSKRPFMFRLSGTVESANIHVVNLPKDSKVSSPDDAHKGQKNFILENQPADILGFFSTEHKAIFTHHDTFLHMHLLTADRKKMGHLEEAVLGKGMKLFLEGE